MAKAKHQSSPAARPLAARSILNAAHSAFGRGDVVEARRLATAVLAGAREKDEDAAELALAPLISAPGAAVAQDPQSVARAILRMTRPPARAYLFAVAVAGVLAFLVAFAIHFYDF